MEPQDYARLTQKQITTKARKNENTKMNLFSFVPLLGINPNATSSAEARPRQIRGYEMEVSNGKTA